MALGNFGGRDRTPLQRGSQLCIWKGEGMETVTELALSLARAPSLPPGPARVVPGRPNAVWFGRRRVDSEAGDGQF